jgi:hypothetical protein
MELEDRRARRNGRGRPQRKQEQNGTTAAEAERISPEHAGGGQRQLDDVPPVPEGLLQGELGLGPVVSLREVDVRSEEEEHEEVGETGRQGGAVEAPTQVVDEQPAVSMLLVKGKVLGKIVGATYR